MANIAAKNTNKFVGISALHVIKGGFGSAFALPDGGVLEEIPVAEDGGFTYTGGEPSIEHYKIHGLTADWTSRTTPGETEVNLFIPSITKNLLELFGFNVTDATAGGSAAGLKIKSGFTFAETSLAVNLGIAAINDESNKLFGIKAAKLSATIVFDEANSAKPIGISLTGSTSAGGDADAMGIFELDND
jgi:hypothetical protein